LRKERFRRENLFATILACEPFAVGLSYALHTPAAYMINDCSAIRIKPLESTLYANEFLANAIAEKARTWINKSMPGIYLYTVTSLPRIVSTKGIGACMFKRHLLLCETRNLSTLATLCVHWNDLVNYVFLGDHPTCSRFACRCSMPSIMNCLICADTDRFSCLAILRIVACTSGSTCAVTHGFLAS